MAVSAYFGRKDLEARLSASTVRELYDDNNDGVADGPSIDGLIADSCSKVDSYLRGVYPLPLSAPYPYEVKRLAIDVGVAYAAQRHPEVVRREWEKLMKQAEHELNEMRRGQTRIDVPDGSSVGAPKNVGGVVTSIGPRLAIPNADGSGGTGDF